MWEANFNLGSAEVKTDCDIELNSMPVIALRRHLELARPVLLNF